MHKKQVTRLHGGLIETLSTILVLCEKNPSSILLTNGHLCGAMMFSLSVWKSCWTNNRVPLIWDATTFIWRHFNMPNVSSIPMKYAHCPVVLRFVVGKLLFSWIHGLHLHYGTLSPFHGLLAQSAEKIRRPQLLLHVICYQKRCGRGVWLGAKCGGWLNRIKD